MVRLTDEGILTKKKSGEGGSSREKASEGWVHHQKAPILLQKSYADLLRCQRETTTPAQKRSQFNPQITSHICNTHQIKNGLNAERWAHSQLKNGLGGIHTNQYRDVGLSNYNKAQTVINGVVGLIEDNCGREMDRNIFKATGDDLQGHQLKNRPSSMGNCTALRMGCKEWLGPKLKAGWSASDGRINVRLGRQGVGCDYAGITPLDGYSSVGKKLKNNINAMGSIGRTQTDVEPQKMTKKMEDEFLNSTVSSIQPEVDFKGKGMVLRGIHGGNVTIDEGEKIGYTDMELHSDPGMNYTTTKRKATKLEKIKPKQKEFRVGRIRSSKEVLDKESKAEGNMRAGNTWFEGKVYSRRSIKTPIIDLEKGKEVLGDTSLEGTDIGDCQGVEDHQLDFCQSSEDSSSDIFETDNEALLCTEADTEGEREKAEKKGLEGFRCLMESKMGVDNISVGNEWISIGDPQKERGGFRPRTAR